AQYEHDLRQLAAMCRAIGASLGAMMDNDGKTIALVDDQGSIVPAMTALAAFAVMAWRIQPGATVAVPVTAPLMFEQLAAEHGGRVQRVAANPLAQMQAAEANPTLALAGDGDGSYIFPDFHPGFDGMMAVARLLEYLGTLNVRLSEVLAGLPAYHLARTEVPCPWEIKGRVMRLLHEHARQHGGDEQAQIDGVRFQFDGEWTLVLPDPDRPVFHVYAESLSPEHASALAEKYVELVRRLESQAA